MQRRPFARRTSIRRRVIRQRRLIYGKVSETWRALRLPVGKLPEERPKPEPNPT